MKNLKSIGLESGSMLWYKFEAIQSFHREFIIGRIMKVIKDLRLIKTFITWHTSNQVRSDSNLSSK